MEQRAQRYVRRPRGWRMYANDDQLEQSVLVALEDSKDGAPRGRRRRTHFGEHITATTTLIGYGEADAVWITTTSELLLPHAVSITAEIYRELLAHPETAAQFSDAHGAIDRERVAVRQEAFRDWLQAVFSAPLDAGTAEYLAAVGRAHVRREPASMRIKARYLLITIARVQALVLNILASTIADPETLAACGGAWNKRLMIHLDLLLAVYGSAESSAHWY